MALPNVNIKFGNGQIRSTVQTPDGVFGVLASAAATAGFQLGKAYMVKSLTDVSALGILPDVNNYALHKFLSNFYAEAGEGAEIWIYGMPKADKMSKWYSPDAVTAKVPAQTLLDAAGGNITMLFNAFQPDGTYTPTIQNGLDADVMVAMSAAQTFAESYTAKKYAPFSVIFPGYGFTGTVADLQDLNLKNYNRCGAMIGDTVPVPGTAGANGSALGVLAGRLAAYPVHINIGKVKNGPLKPLLMYIKDQKAELFDVEGLHNKGYISIRTHQGKSGYFFTDDPLATSTDDDYRSIARRRVIDKAYRLAYRVLIEEALNEAAINPDGTLSLIYAKDLEARVESYLNANMTGNGELPYDLQNPVSPVAVQVDAAENIAATSRLKMTIRLRPWAYARTIEASLSYQIQRTS